MKILTKDEIQEFIKQIIPNETNIQALNIKTNKVHNHTFDHETIKYMVDHDIPFTLECCQFYDWKSLASDFVVFDGKEYQYHKHMNPMNPDHFLLINEKNILIREMIHDNLEFYTDKCKMLRVMKNI